METTTIIALLLAIGLIGFPALFFHIGREDGKAKGADIGYHRGYERGYESARLVYDRRD